MADCKVWGIDSSVVGLSYAIEECPGQLPSSGVVWTRVEPSGYSDFGATLTIGERTAGSVIRRAQRGSITGVEASAGWNADYTPTGGHDEMAALALRAGVQTRARQNISLTTASTITVERGAAFGVGALVRITGSSSDNNNSLILRVNGVTGNVLTVASLTAGKTLAAIPSGGQNGRVTHVGNVFGIGNLRLEVTANSVSLARSSGTVNLSTALGLSVGDWIYVGGDTTASRFTSGGFFGRVSTLSETAIGFSRITGAQPTQDAGAGKEIEIYLPRRVRDPVVSSEVLTRTVTWERTLGKTDTLHESAEYVTGAALDEMEISAPSNENITVSYTFAAADAEVTDGTQPLKAGTRVTLPKTAPYSTATDTVRTHIALQSQPTPWAPGMFEFVSDVNITVNNNSSRPEAHRRAGSKYGGLGASLGALQAGGSLTAYYAGAAAVKAVREAAAVTMDTIAVRENFGIVIDLPLVTLSDAQITVEENTYIKLPLTMTAAESADGYIMGMYFFDGLPSAARD